MQSKQIFKTPYTGRERQFTETGSPIANTYEHKIDEFGRKKLVITGQINVYERIQEQLEETKIENIMARAIAGDTSMLRPDGIYADLTEMPNNLIEARQAIQNLENVWNKLSRDIKEKYNYNVEEFIAKSGTETWLKDMGLYKSESKEEIKANETPITEPTTPVKEKE